MVTPQTLFKEISAGKFKPAYYFFGSEDYRITEAEKYIAGQFLPDLQRTTNYRKIDGRRTSCTDLALELSNLPMLGERQLFAISDFQSYSPKEVVRILGLLSPPDVNRVVIFKSPSVRAPKKKSALLKNLDAAVEVVQFDRLNEGEVSRRASGRLKKAGIEIEPAALKLLIALIAGDGGGLEGEVNKLLNYKANGGVIEVSDVERVCSGHEVHNIFELADKVVAGDVGDVLKTLNGLVAEGHSPVTLTTLLQQHFTSLYLVKNGKRALGNRNFPFILNRLRRQGSRYDNIQLEQIIIQIAETHADLLKGKVKKQETLVEMLMIQLVQGSGGRGMRP
ncbi:MAG: DNA polymerase III subunit delta [candidate division Zixibacteria bacterium]|nr:DNA polymerase III subunit delta [candidate division Zixibacteria bacterium]